ncbi:uroporphyrinogen-III C-methyltransferase [Aquirufa rosea]|uniref:uroporphyrinogen-III C-methyltransferase n=1 Tax=Aquirufa rosea TaxID=2509241 RepID=A0A4Q1BZY0_9BACT|nr:uroporphyrinogen-III C-methyltransferase [Aquirufa rosea]RXK49637.1 uroporphyrinogen-III C-methyltransferase [Aquirufa rosea]
MIQQLSRFKSLEPQPQLSVVGAGPGDPELITVKAIKALEKAQAVLYDSLVDISLLDYCSPICEKIFVGKKAGESHSQNQINELIVKKAYELGHVVRLKGGDPFVFGRGQEEIDYARQFGLQTAYIPGISSSYAAAGAADIPLTIRGVNESFWVMTGTKSDGTLSNDLHLGLQSTATLVILMGMHRLGEISRICQEAGKGHISAAIVQQGTTSAQKLGVGLAGELENLAKNEDLSNPAVIIIGEVVRHSVGDIWEKVSHIINKNEQ